ncbi:MAG TPA: hypothetical protein VGG11_00955 [Xanthobacteraceae bacterium]
MSGPASGMLRSAIPALVLKSKSLCGTLALTGISLAVLALNASCAGPTQMAPAAVSAPVPARLTTEAPFESWRLMIQQVPKPRNTCATARYPELQWHEIPCAKPPNDPLLPARGMRGAMVGDGTDFTAMVRGHVTFAVGEFQDVTGVKSEYVEKRKHHIANVYSLQLNTQFFSTESCASLGSPDPKNCFGWEQFAYDSGRPVGVFIEYWLADFGPGGTKCPSHWHKLFAKTQNEVDCWINSALIPTPVIPITSLKTLRLLGSSAYSSRSQDFAELIIGNSSIYYVAGQNWFPDLDVQWQTAEFNIFGDCCGDQATFNAGSTIDVRTEVDSGKTMAPTCGSQGFTAESNNLFLTKTPSKWPKTQYPSIIFAETNNAERAKASCATEGS